jgi:hypothetical protein
MEWNREDLEKMVYEAIDKHKILKDLAIVTFKEAMDDLRSSPSAIIEVEITWNGFFCPDDSVEEDGINSWKRKEGVRIVNLARVEEGRRS